MATCELWLIGNPARQIQDRVLAETPGSETPRTYVRGNRGQAATLKLLRIRFIDFDPDPDFNPDPDFDPDFLLVDVYTDKRHPRLLSD